MTEGLDPLEIPDADETDETDGAAESVVVEEPARVASTVAPLTWRLADDPRVLRKLDALARIRIEGDRDLAALDALRTFVEIRKESNAVLAALDAALKEKR